MEHVFNCRNLPKDFTLFMFSLSLDGGSELKSPFSVEIKQFRHFCLGSTQMKIYQEFIDCDSFEDLFDFLHGTLAREWFDCSMPFTLIIESVLPWRDETDESTLSAQERNPNLK